jgi:formiminotetrahydrofolate cyclodeaminase
MADEIPYANYALIDLLDAFASNEPVPGGGSAAAMAGALAVSLLIMVAGLPKTRTGTPEEATDLAEASARFRLLRERLVELIDEDSGAYRSFIAALKLPRSTDAEKAARDDARRSAMRDATETPLNTMRCCQQALAGAVIVARNGHVAAASDAGVAIELLAAVIRGCAMNIDVNLKAMSDAAFVERVGAERRELETIGLADAENARGLLPL